MLSHERGINGQHHQRQIVVLTSAGGWNCSFVDYQLKQWTFSVDDGFHFDHFIYHGGVRFTAAREFGLSTSAVSGPFQGDFAGGTEELWSVRLPSWLLVVAFAILPLSRFRGMLLGRGRRLKLNRVDG
jgi:hypothetical protein